MEFKQMQRGPEREKYWIGPENKFIRLWVYAQRGLGEFNEFKYFVLAFVAFVGLIYLKVSLLVVVIIMIILVPVALVILIKFGKWHVHKAQKTEQWVQTEFGNILKFNDYNIKVQTLDTLEKIEKLLEKGR